MKTPYGQKWYKPMEIARLGLIKSSAVSDNDVYKGSIAGHYNYVLKLIKNGTLKAKNYSNGPRPYYLVPESEIERYHKTFNKVGGQPRGTR